MVDNTVTIIGNLTADPEVRVTDSGATLAEIRMAQNKRKRIVMVHGMKVNQCFSKEQFGMIWPKMRHPHYKKECE